MYFSCWQTFVICTEIWLFHRNPRWAHRERGWCIRYLQQEAHGSYWVPGRQGDAGRHPWDDQDGGCCRLNHSNHLSSIFTPIDRQTRLRHGAWTISLKVIASLCMYSRFPSYWGNYICAITFVFLRETFDDTIKLYF